MRFELNVLGSGSAIPLSNRNTTAQVLNVLERFFLIDCGEGTQNRIRQNKLSFGKINHILISHLHGDHFYGIFGLISTLSLMGRSADLNIYGPPLLKNLVNHVLNIQDSQPGYQIHFHELDNSQPHIIFSDRKVEVTSFPLRHTTDVCGFLFKEKERDRKINANCIDKYQIGIAEMNALKKGEDLKRGEVVIPNAEVTLDPLPPRSYAFLTDTVVSREYVGILEGVDVMYHESTFLHRDKKLARKTAHSTALGAAELARIVNPKLLLLGHYSARYPEVCEFEQEARSVFPNTVGVLDRDKVVWPVKEHENIQFVRRESTDMDRWG